MLKKSKLINILYGATVQPSESKHASTEYNTENNFSININEFRKDI